MNIIKKPNFEKQNMNMIQKKEKTEQKEYDNHN